MEHLTDEDIDRAFFDLGLASENERQGFLKSLGVAESLEAEHRSEGAKILVSVVRNDSASEGMSGQLE